MSTRQIKPPDISFLFDMPWHTNSCDRSFVSMRFPMLNPSWNKTRWLQSAGGGMAPAGLLKREHAVDGSSWTRKRIHSKLGARSGAFFGIEIHRSVIG